ncbi:putative proteasome 26S non-ATPase subunit 9 [Leptomonas pyrrhocoris]|uniref:Putative proteasome 26S non-ATPase subunit 9 n=1 Tax=Leptomonas pyrrhocoris TaxID=157538 RepID=A0A0M9FWZ3_LEPPY|nr:putative proteasome 26S non-ATPase subunit 9 [Leptomonas pyrrhocoris]XP_015656240.1 putative proteasome 26S non-ATPase subunit 9 [Leptomonas pyrrhocoris]KPA77800.1 putative proteasome 26S non-ATPase subunit 9 [Leptomonas pyrrhocoris]KPA77801.1 putative proteasome 26S non-ATPase subunit 9 [Leptomonas pyrrhocoris]|eukprot:XP_015656239.1 putative proteasome 26S non-ATPase subunit 9 [Leptomonas pyrrhocoris]
MSDAAREAGGANGDERTAPVSPSPPIEEMDADTMRSELRRLDEEKARLERQLTEALQYLASTPVGLHKRLVDDEGFPRSDCDLYAVRVARNTADSTRNDLRALSEKMYALLNALHHSTQEEAELQMVQDAASRRQRQVTAEKRAQRMAEVQRVRKLPPCLVVAKVDSGSPAEEAGLGTGMRILQYGAITKAELAAEGLQALMKETTSHAGEPITVWVQKPGELEDDPTDLVLVPQRWSGPGLLGCALDLCEAQR